MSGNRSRGCLPACLCENTCLIQNRSDEESWSPQKLLVYAPSIAVLIEPREQRDRSERSRPVLLESLPSLACRPSGKHPITVGYLLYSTSFHLVQICVPTTCSFLLFPQRTENFLFQYLCQADFTVVCCISLWKINKITYKLYDFSLLSRKIWAWSYWHNASNLRYVDIRKKSQLQVLPELQGKLQAHSRDLTDPILKCGGTRL